MEMVWDLFEAEKLDKEEANKLLNDYKELIKESIEDINWRLNDERYK